MFQPNRSASPRPAIAPVRVRKNASRSASVKTYSGIQAQVALRFDGELLEEVARVLVDAPEPVGVADFDDPVDGFDPPL